jgi:hypothetical protein
MEFVSPFAGVVDPGSSGQVWLALLVTLQERPICFVIGLLVDEPVHFADLFLAYGALL